MFSYCIHPYIIGQDKRGYHTFTRKYVHFAYVILTWFSSTYHLWSAKGVIMGHMGDTAFLPGQKTISPGHVGDTAFLPGQKNPYHQVTWIIQLFCPGKKNPYHQVMWVIRLFCPGQKACITTFGALSGLAFDSLYNIK